MRGSLEPGFEARGTVAGIAEAANGFEAEVSRVGREVRTKTALDLPDSVLLDPVDQPGADGAATGNRRQIVGTCAADPAWPVPARCRDNKVALRIPRREKASAIRRAFPAAPFGWCWSGQDCLERLLALPYPGLRVRQRATRNARSIKCRSVTTDTDAGGSCASRSAGERKASLRRG